MPHFLARATGAVAAVEQDNLPSALDITWLKQGGGLFSKGVHPPAERFNAGQKLIFWSVIVISFPPVAYPAARAATAGGPRGPERTPSSP